MKNDKGRFYNTVAELGGSGIFLWAIILQLSASVLSMIYEAADFNSQYSYAIENGSLQTFASECVYNIVAITVSFASSALLLRIYLSFKNGRDCVASLKRMIIIVLAENLINVLWFAAYFIVHYVQAKDLTDFIAIAIALIAVSVILISIISAFVFLAARKTLRLAIALIEQDIDGILKYKASVFLIIFCVYTIIFNLGKLLSDFTLSSVLSLPGIASMVLFLILLIKFRASSYSAVKKANTQERKAKRYDI